MRFILRQIFILLFSFISLVGYSQYSNDPKLKEPARQSNYLRPGFNQHPTVLNHYFVYPDTLPRPLRAALLSLFPDVFIFSINRWINKSDFAYITGQTITNNFMFNALWDNDLWGTNLLSHPFHGSLDYNGARVSGMNYWQCFPYVFTASFIWETILENEPPSFNDQIATSIGGMVLGEASYRISSSILKDNTKGFQRVVREVFGAVTCPMNGINRLLTGQMWKVQSNPRNLEYFSDNLKNYYISSFNKNLYHNEYCAPKIKYMYPDSKHLGYKYVNIQANAEVSYRNVRFNNPKHKNDASPFISVNYVYGNPFDTYDVHPLDYFRFKVGLNIKKDDNFLNFLEVTGLLWGKEIKQEYNGINAMWGIFQHFRYKDREGIKTDSIPTWRYSDPASVGIGIITDTRTPKNNFLFEGHLNLAFLASAPASNFSLKGRQYNYGQGYSINLLFDYTFSNRVNLGMENYLLQFFTWKGYDKNIIVEAQDIKTFRAMGDKGNTVLFQIRPYMNVYLFSGLSLHFNYTMFNQYTYNKDYPNLSTSFSDYNLGLRYNF